MNMAQRADQFDYEPDVLKFKQIWDEMKDTKKETKNKNKELLGSGTRASKSKKNLGHKNSEEGRQKKQTIVSQKNLVRNPKKDNEQVIQVVTRQTGIPPQPFKDKKQFVKREEYVQSVNSPTLQTEVASLKKVVGEKDYQLSLLRVSNTRNEDRIRVLQNQIQQRDERIRQLERRERQLLSHNNGLSNNEKVFDYGQVEYENYRNDSKRLLKMLQTTQEYQQFANLALDDNGVRFLNSVNKNVKSFLDTKEKTKLHFCTCNKDFIPESGFWVPEKVYTTAKDFVRERKGQITNAQLELLLYDLNKIWRQREKRIMNTLNSQKAKEVEKLKRKIGVQKSGVVVNRE